MARASRGPVGLALLALAVVALAAVALVPRGVVRTVAASRLVPIATDLPAGIDDATGRPVHLPGVRAMLSKDEQDPARVLLEQLVAVEVPTYRPIPDVGQHRPEELPTQSDPSDRSTPAGRGPPAPI